MKMELTWKLLKEYIQYSTVFYHYDEDLKRANFYSNDEETILEINHWILDYFPHYLDNIDYGKCDDSDNHRNNPSNKKLYLSLICIESGYEEVEQIECEHKNTEWIPAEPEVNVGEDVLCDDCGKSIIDEIEREDQ